MFLDNNKENYIDDVKSMSYEELDLFAVELREFLIDSVSKTGGHLASNLGTVELTLALHRVFDTPKDKIVFDVGHQTYVHKILTGRKAEFENLRQLGGISGFPKRSESEHDMYDSGHSSTSISAAYGYAVARDIKGEDYSCVAVIGDGAMTGGVAFEALNMAGASKTPLIVILNDNQMSIDSSKGSLKNHLNSLRTSSSYQSIKKNIKKTVSDETVLYRFLRNTRDALKDAMIPSGIFEELGFKYFGPIDGHNIRELTTTLKFAKELKRPVLIHILTQKGKGFIPAEKNPSKFHGIGSFDPNTVSSEDKADPNSYSEIFGNKLLQLAENDDRICGISAAMIGATGLNHLQKKFPKRVFDVGIAEQHAVSFAAGLALNGMRPVVAVYSTFLQRGFDEILSEVAMQNLPVIFAIDRAGVTGHDGETHHGSFDISYFSLMPNMTVLAPKDGVELEAMLEYALTLDGPCAIRFPRGKNFDLSEYTSDDAVCRAELCSDDADYAILALGSMVKEAIDAGAKLEEAGLYTAVYNMRQVKPLQFTFLDNIKDRYNKIITVEDGCLNGGMGQQIAEYFAKEDNSIPVLCLSWPDKFIEHGDVAQLRHEYGLDAEGIAESAKEFFTTNI